ncbi:PspC domain-containing protein [Vagococcus sp. DIV0080]|jgi:phage shock protein PspC (stress-responsive transcriptional regulator)|uniref:PspC domain-containing protein n=1 Tax=Candidatus Vagococcus giribetii TaxID=2230876 RepID=A0ABS3HRH2_9ENTE|nr:PspC domain-containing protein [Vagococcus sp. DIV0080]MBO0476356.1 PspC domain-containing protein [Vagococcus sp. DIV0080]
MSKKLTKSSSNVVISGSLAGVAEYIGIDPTIVRVIYVILSLVTTGFPGFLLYIALMVLLPSGTNQRRSNFNTYDEPFEQYHPYEDNKFNRKKAAKPRKEAEKVKVEEDDWSDF